MNQLNKGKDWQMKPYKIFFSSLNELNLIRTNMCDSAGLESESSKCDMQVLVVRKCSYTCK